MKDLGSTLIQGIGNEDERSPRPGLSVKPDCPGPLGLSVTKAAKVLNIMSPEWRSGRAETWYSLQASYDVAQAMKKASRIEVRRVPLPAFEAN